MVWAKHAPSFESVFPDKAHKEMTDEEMYNMARSLNAMLGGEEE